MKRTIACVVGTVLALCLAGTAWAVTPANGNYGGFYAGTSSEGDGSFILAGGTITPFPNPAPPAITAPSSFVCNQLNAKLEATSIPVTNGTFNYKGKANIGLPVGSFTRMNIRFKGHWTSAKKLAGTTRIWNASCDHTDHWKMHSPYPP